MSFRPSDVFTALEPDELNLLQRVYERITPEPWVSRDPEVQERLARYILDMFQHGLCWENKLYEFCLVAARAKFADAASGADPRKVSGQ